MIKKEHYLQYLKDICDANIVAEITRLETALKEEVKKPVALTRATYFALQSVTVFQGNKNETYLNYALTLVKKGFETYRNFLEVTPEENTNEFYQFMPINYMFGLGLFCKLIMFLKDNLLLDEKDEETAKLIIMKGCDWCCEYTDWGTHNRALARASNLLLACKTFPELPETAFWYKVYHAIKVDNIGKWSIEDAATYNPIWLEDLMEIAEIEEIDNPNFLTVIKYYLDLYTYVQNPLFMPTEFGDGRLGTQWAFVVSILEKGASLFNNGYYKYVARRIFNKMAYLGDLTGFNAIQSRAIISAYHSSDDSILEKEPYGKSMEVMDDYVGKKIVFRNGWNSDKSTFLFLNYRDFSETGILGRRNLDYTIIAPAEKNHHGHSDENAINLLTYKDSVLLHDGGYREKIDMSGAYRADFYHNKLIVRNGFYSDFFESMFEEPNHNRVRTEKLYFYDFKYLDTSRTRIYDEMHGVIHDRTISFVKNENLFVVADIVKASRSGDFTFSNQYFSQDIKKVSDTVFQTSFREIGTDEVLKICPNNDDIKLTIAFFNSNPESKVLIRDIRRSYQTETMISDLTACTLKKDEFFTTVSFLLPNDNFVNKELIESINVETKNNGLSVSFYAEDRYYELDFKLDDTFGLDKDKLPMYSFENTKTDYQRATSDGLFSSYMLENNLLTYNFVFGSRVIFDEQVVFSLRERLFKQFDFTMESRVGSYNAYENSKNIEKRKNENE